MPFAAKIVMGVFAGGLVGYILSRLLAGDRRDSFASNRPVMALLGAVMGVVLTTVAFRGNTAMGAYLASPAEFNEKVLGSDKPVVVDFYADRCPPCRRMMPVLEKLEHEYAGRITFFRVDVDEARGLAAAHGIRAIPTLLFYRNGQKVGHLVGGRPEAVLRQDLEALLGGS